MIHLCTDGSCLTGGYAGYGGWAFYYSYGGKSHQGSGALIDTTNNRAELYGVIHGLKSVRHTVPTNTQVLLVSDSLYVVNGARSWIDRWIANQWRGSNGEPIKNRDLWEEIIRARHGMKLRYQWVRGHNGHEGNERVDRLATQATWDKIRALRI